MVYFSLFSPDMLAEWMHCEEHTEIAIDDDSDTDEDITVKEIDPSERNKEMKKVQLQSVHNLGGVLDDVKLINTSRELWLHAERELSQMSKSLEDVVSLPDNKKHLNCSLVACAVRFKFVVLLFVYSCIWVHCKSV